MRPPCRGGLRGHGVVVLPVFFCIRGLKGRCCSRRWPAIIATCMLLIPILTFSIQPFLLPTLVALCQAESAAAQGFDKTGKPVIRSGCRPKGKIYRDGRIDINKNGKIDISGAPAQPVDKRIEDLLSTDELRRNDCQACCMRDVLRHSFPSPGCLSHRWQLRHLPP